MNSGLFGRIVVNRRGWCQRPSCGPRWWPGKVPTPRVDLPLKHGDLVSQDQDLGILGPVGAGGQSEPAEHPEQRKSRRLVAITST